MTISELIKKHGQEEAEFDNLYKNQIHYKHKGLGLYFTMTVEYRDDFSRLESIMSLSQMDDFDFSTIIT
jgi:hypothetical protein